MTAPVWRWRRRLAVVGLVALVALASFDTFDGSQAVAPLAFGAFVASTLLAWVELRSRTSDRGGRQSASNSDLGALDAAGTGAGLSGSRRSLVLSVLVTVAVSGGAVQTWFLPGTAIAGGDLAPPNGTAWLGQLFSPWTWSGSDLGRLGSVEPQLPWGVVLWAVHQIGGSSATAQRLWFSLLFVGAALGGLWLLRVLRTSWTVATVGSLLYVFNPFVVSNVGTNPVFLAALVLVVVEPAIMISVGSGRWTVRTGVVALVATVPLVGYAYENPPLVLAAIAAALAGLALAVLWYRRSAIRLLGKFLGLGAPLAVAAALYWVVPAVEQLHLDALGQLSSLSSWTWTEARSTLNNAFWLNTSWAWNYKIYVPFSGHYSSLPLSFLRYALPMMAFSALLLPYRAEESSRRELQLVACASTGSLAIIFLSTGTRPPGSILFDILYRIPYGWLLQGPGRFLLLVGVAYVLMASVSIGACLRRLDSVARSARLWTGERRTLRNLILAAVIVVVGALAPGYPLAVGAIAPGPRGDALPSTHVRVPAYWDHLAAYLNGPASPRGDLLVLPPDPFYQMPYTWGYYGNDGFITDMVRRNVVDPAGQGYSAAGADLLTAVNQVATALLAGDTTATTRLLRALGTPDVLVREDINTRSPGSQVVSPKALVAALAADPQATLVHRSGPLFVFRVAGAQTRAVNRQVPYATSQSSVPNLLALSVLGRRTVLVRHSPIPGVSAVVPVPPEAAWHLQGNHLVENVPLPTRRSYTLARLDATGRRVVTFPLSSRAVRTGGIAVYVHREHSGTHAEVSVAVGSHELTDGYFRAGEWGVVGNCNAAPTSVPADLRAHLGPPAPGLGGRSLLLSADSGAACEARSVAWSGGPVLVSFAARRITGAGPAICLWEIGPNRCASMTPLSASARWHTYQEVVTPNRGTHALSLFLYAYAGSGTRTEDAYSGVSIRSAATQETWAIIAAGGAAHRPPELTTMMTAFSNYWSVGTPAQHVLVDGIMNGWLSDANRRVTPHDSLAGPIRASAVGAGAAAVVTLIIGCTVLVAAVRRRRPRVGDR